MVISEQSSLSCCLNNQGILIPLAYSVVHNGLPPRKITASND